MSFGEVMGLMLVVGGIVAVFGILGEAYKARMLMKQKHFEAMAAQSANRAPDARTERLEARIRVLERIATDKTAKLSAEIEDLREPAN